MGIEKVLKLELLDFDEEYRKDMESGLGFPIFDKGLSKAGKRNMNGIYSPLYGSELTEDNETKYDQYRCECGNLIGKFYEGTVCPQCGTTVEVQVDDIYKTGWILFEGYSLINPLIYNFIAKFIGPKNLDDIIKFNREISRDGFIEPTQGSSKNPFVNYGLFRFKEEFDEILEYFKKKNKKEDKLEFYSFIQKHRDKVFIDKFPVFSLILRPILMIRNEVLYSDINKKYQVLVTWSQSLASHELTIDEREIKTMPILYQAQVTINDIHQSIISSFLAEKKGLIRANLIGARLNFSSRSVIVPLVGETEIDEVHVPYLTFLELYKFELINMICNFDKVPFNEANRRWNEATLKFDEKIYLMMMHIIKNTKGGVRCIVNRNPSLNLGSILVMRITNIKRNIEDLTISLPIYVLGLLSADFDGDVIALISLKDQAVVEALEPVFNPKFMIIDKNNGRFNRRLALIKDQMIGLYAFCNR